MAVAGQIFLLSAYLLFGVFITVGLFVIWFFERKPKASSRRIKNFLPSGRDMLWVVLSGRVLTTEKRGFLRSGSFHESPARKTFAKKLLKLNRLSFQCPPLSQKNLLKMLRKK